MLLKRLCRALRSLFNWKGVGRLQTANHPWYRKYEEASIILFYFSIPNCVFIDSVRLQFLGSIIGSLLLYASLPHHSRGCLGANTVGGGAILFIHSRSHYSTLLQGRTTALPHTAVRILLPKQF